MSGETPVIENQCDEGNATPAATVQLDNNDNTEYSSLTQAVPRSPELIIAQMRPIDMGFLQHRRRDSLKCRMMR